MNAHKEGRGSGTDLLWVCPPPTGAVHRGGRVAGAAPAPALWRPRAPMASGWSSRLFVRTPSLDTVRFRRCARPPGVRSLCQRTSPTTEGMSSEGARSSASETAVADAGVIGLAVMGQNLALNLASHGFAVSVYNRTYARTEETVERALRELGPGPGPGPGPSLGDGRAADPPVQGFADLKSFARSLKRPRKVFLLVKAGDAVDATVEALAEVLEAGDIIVDGGNEWYENTERRAKSVSAHGLLYVGMGVSGGEDGARHGPSLMPGGSREAYAQLEPLLVRIAAQVPGSGPCVTYVGPGGSGNYVKMVHNGIEYGDMQLIGEAYDLLRGVGGLSASSAADVFATWNAGDLQSFLVEITARILRVCDDVAGAGTSSSSGADGSGTAAGCVDALVDRILDRSGSKGTGMWTVAEALRRGVAVPTIAAALDGRYLSAMKGERERASRVLCGPERPVTAPSLSLSADLGAAGPDTATTRPQRGAATMPDMNAGRADLAAPSVPTHTLVAAVGDALFCSKLCSYAQGLSLLQTASSEQGWSLKLSELARIWKGGCIIRAQLLERIEAAFRREPGLPNLLLDEMLAADIARRQDGWRRCVALAAAHGVPAPALTASLSYYDTYRQGVLRSSQLVQAQRDCFGSHTYERLDRPGRVWHTRWTGDGQSVEISA
ncbi:hypothetical protein CCYA_CCYA07G2152 [Cyanidiococcus yangmingshanensis]|nr:hypothetical protein CCYA_CCYA07G2152 [Cyanidiococcus yangmingshanensis]